MDFTVSLNEQIAELDREIRLRERVYRNWIAAGKIKQDVAELRTARMRAAKDTLRNVEQMFESALLSSNETERRIIRELSGCRRMPGFA